MGALALHFLVLTLSGWLQREQYGVVHYLIDDAGVSVVAESNRLV
jgi:hypothetical protein